MIAVIITLGSNHTNSDNPGLIIERFGRASGRVCGGISAEIVCDRGVWRHRGRGRPGYVSVFDVHIGIHI
jgi:hypothetical protein